MSRFLLIVISLTAAGFASPASPGSRERVEDAETLIRRVIEFQERQQELTRQYAFREKTLTRNLDSEGRVEKTESETYLVTPAPGGEYRRLLARNGEPLDPKEEAEEERKYQKYLDEQLRLSPEERNEKTEEKMKKRAKRARERLEEALEVFDFHPLEDEIVQGERLRVFRFAPKPGYEGRSRETRIFARMEGKVWIDPRHDQLARLKVRFREDLKFLGGVFGRVSRGTEAEAGGWFDGQGLWLLDQVDISLDARLYFLKTYRQRITLDFHDYERYTVATDERVGSGSFRR